MSTIRIHTTQNVTLEYEVASLGDRILAALIDYGLYLVWFLLCAVLNSQFGLGLGQVGVLLMLLPTMVYHLACEVFFNGQSLGKKARHIKVIRLDGTRPSLGNYVLRWLLRPIEILTFGGAIAALTILLNGRGQRLGDLAAGTAVISLKPRPQHASPLSAGLTSSDYMVVFPQAAQLSDHDVAVVRQLLFKSVQRQNYLLLNEVAVKVKSVTGIRTDLPDEAFLRTILRDHAHLLMQQV
ncbi:RDD family protein [Hymenobacter jejuensis]|uniref:RDD family protein n=1 Tax=Hymenobacter jejuensis TaxID=2502781 RepID=A0A5B8A1H0_9BACT|nr:RDD family protein [Hymenobacter jejuensis]QDA61138.1 RDD family protein [Hymenobacter jejuensis]